MPRTKPARTVPGPVPGRYDGLRLKAPVLWPGITTGDNAMCSCSWSYLGGVRQVKMRNGSCIVHIRAGAG